MRTTAGMDLGVRKVCVPLPEAKCEFQLLTYGDTANTMANGKDFFIELRKQVTALRQGGTVAGG